MSSMYLFKIFESNYCKSVFLIAFLGSYFLMPDTIFNGFYYIIAISFMVMFSLSVMCIIRSAKDRAMLVKKYKGSLLNIVAAALGFSALQVCGVAAPICGAGVSVGVLSVLLPKIFIGFLATYSVFIIIFSIFLQLVSLYLMHCFSKTRLAKK